jgi:predicted transcriptional regulator
MKTPCEIIVWQVLPAIRKEIAIKLVNEHSFSQRKAAEKLGITESSVSRYISGKRGASEILNEDIHKEIKKSTSRIIEGNSKTVIIETCRICNLLKSSNFIENISYCGG